MPLVRKPAAPGAASPETDWRETVAVLQNGALEERWAAVRALAAEPRAADALGAALAREPDPGLRETMFSSLARLNSPASFDALMPHLRADDAHARSLALDAMALMPERLRERLPGLLRDDDADIRVLACELARQVPAAEGAALLAAMLAREPEVNVCAAAIGILAELGDAGVLPALAACDSRFPDDFFLHFSVKNASEQIRARIGA